MDVNILLADDHQLFRDALRVLLEQERGLKVVAETGNGQEVVGLAEKIRPDIVCMDIAMPVMSGIEAARRLKKSCPEVRIIGISGLTERRPVQEMLEAGAVGYLTKAAAGEQLIQAIRSVMQGHRFICPEAAQILENTATPRSAASHGSALPPLSVRERQVLTLVAEGHTSVQIAARLQMSPSTAEVHRRNIMRKLDLHSIAELTKYAIREGLTSN